LRDGLLRKLASKRLDRARLCEGNEEALHLHALDRFGSSELLASFACIFFIAIASFKR
jgi:hypothetical protein